MSSTIRSLHTTLWKRQMKSNPSSLFMNGLFGLYMFMILVPASFVLFFALREPQANIIPGMIGAAVLTYALVQLFIPSGEKQVSPSDLALIPLNAEQVRSGFIWVAFLQIRPILASIAAICAGTVLSFADISLVWIIWPMLLVALITCVFLGEVLGTAIGRTKGKEKWFMVGSLVIFGIFMAASSLFEIKEEHLRMVGTAMAWTPMGAAGGAIDATAAGNWGVGAAQVIIALLTMVAVLWWWNSQLRRNLVEPVRADSGGKRKRERRQAESTGAASAISLPGVPYSPAGVVFSRAMLYWPRDSRLRSLILVYPILVVFLLLQSEEFMTIIGLAMITIFAGTVAGNDFGYDGPAGAQHILSGVSPRTLLLARHAASMLPSIVMVIIYIVAFSIKNNFELWSLLVAAGGIGTLMVSGAFGLLFTVFNPYPTSKPGTNPWNDKSGYSTSAFIVSFGVLIGVPIIMAAPVALTAVGYFSDSYAQMGVGVIAMIVFPVLLYIGAIALGTRRVKDKLPAIYARVGHWVS